MSDQPMSVIVEVWPVVAEPSDPETGYPGGLWLLDADAWRSGPVTATSGPHDTVLAVLATHGAEPLAPHSTSWRLDCDHRVIPSLGSEDAGIVLTYTVPVRLTQPVIESKWREQAQPISLPLAAAVGRQPVTAVTDAPCPRRIDVLLHGLRHLAMLARGVGEDRMGLDEIYRAGLDAAWLEHLSGMAPALATLQTVRGFTAA